MTNNYEIYSYPITFNSSLAFTNTKMFSIASLDNEIKMAFR